jgi:hypothetical protein
MIKSGTFSNANGGKKFYRLQGDQLLEYKAGCRLCSGWHKVTYEEVERMPREEFDFIAGLASEPRPSRIGD